MATNRRGIRRNPQLGRKQDNSLDQPRRQAAIVNVPAKLLGAFWPVGSLGLEAPGCVQASSPSANFYRFFFGQRVPLLN